MPPVSFFGFIVSVVIMFMVIMPVSRMVRFTRFTEGKSIVKFANPYRTIRTSSKAVRVIPVPVTLGSSSSSPEPKGTVFRASKRTFKRSLPVKLVLKLKRRTKVKHGDAIKIATTIGFFIAKNLTEGKTSFPAQLSSSRKLAIF